MINKTESKDIQKIKEVASEAFSQSKKTIDDYIKLGDEIERL